LVPGNSSILFFFSPPHPGNIYILNTAVAFPGFLRNTLTLRKEARPVLRPPLTLSCGSVHRNIVGTEARPVLRPPLTLSCGSVHRNIVGTASSFSSLLLHSRLKQSGVKCSEQMLLYLVGLKFFLLTAASHFLQRLGRVRGNLRR